MCLFLPFAMDFPQASEHENRDKFIKESVNVSWEVWITFML